MIQKSCPCKKAGSILVDCIMNSYHDFFSFFFFLNFSLSFFISSSEVLIGRLIGYFWILRKIDRIEHVDFLQNVIMIYTTSIIEEFWFIYLFFVSFDLFKISTRNKLYVNKLYVTLLIIVDCSSHYLLIRIFQLTWNIVNYRRLHESSCCLSSCVLTHGRAC